MTPLAAVLVMAVPVAVGLASRGVNRLVMLVVVIALGVGSFFSAEARALPQVGCIILTLFASWMVWIIGPWTARHSRQRAT